MSLANAKVRIARPSDDLAALIPFYRDGLGFDILYHFSDHDGFDGIMLGHRGSGHHLEFTAKPGHPVGRAPSQDHLLVFYLPDAGGYDAAVARMESLGVAAVPSFNPYWDRHGRTYEDPDGYRVVLVNSAWEVQGPGDQWTHMCGEYGEGYRRHD